MLPTGLTKQPTGAARSAAEGNFAKIGAINEEEVTRKDFKAMRKSINEILDREIIRIERAAEWLDVARGTFHNWITSGKFTEADGLRRFGGTTRVHFPTMRARFHEGTLLQKPGDRGESRGEKAVGARASESNGRIDLLGSADVATTKPEFRIN